MEGKMWLVWSLVAGVCWGTYVPLIQQGIGGLKSPFGSFLCVGIAYFLIAIIVPVGLLATTEKAPDWNPYGISFATLAGVAGALGALCVIFANRGTVDNKLYIAPIIFAAAPLLNTLISLVWHPSRQNLLDLGLKHTPHWTLYVGIVLTGLGAALVLYSKEASEPSKTGAPTAPVIAPGPAEQS